MKHLQYFVSILLLLMVLQVSDAMAGTPVQPKITTYDFKNFNSLTLSGSVKVYFTQGKNYSIKVEESNSPYLMTIVELKGQVLSIKTKNTRRINIRANSPVVRITAPQLVGIHASGAVAVNISNLKTADFNINTSGASKLMFNDIACNKMLIGCSGASKLNMGKISCPTINLNSSGACEMNMTIVNNKNAVMTFSGASKGSLKYKGDHLKMQSSGAGKININVDCKLLEAHNSGAAKIMISGTADKTEIKSSGASKINTSELNKF
ncbi:MAG: DUF2807 domain-containing protein [Prevotella sp.]|nr:DUF2807 domain-containing protein [Prevotella sp.]